MTDEPSRLRRADDLPEVGITLRAMVLDHEERIRELQDWRRDMAMLGRVLKATFGVSLVGAVIGVLNLMDMLSRQVR